MPVTLGDGARRQKRRTNRLERALLALAHGDGTAVRWSMAIAITLGMVLLVIGANAPSVAACMAGIAILVVIGTVWFVRLRNGQGRRDEITEDDYKRDLIATLNGYGLDGKYDGSDIGRSADAFAARSFDGDRRA